MITGIPRQQLPVVHDIDIPRYHCFRIQAEQLTGWSDTYAIRRIDHQHTDDSARRFVYDVVILNCDNSECTIVRPFTWSAIREQHITARIIPESVYSTINAYSPAPCNFSITSIEGDEILSVITIQDVTVEIKYILPLGFIRAGSTDWPAFDIIHAEIMYLDAVFIPDSYKQYLCRRIEIREDDPFIIFQNIFVIGRFIFNTIFPFAYDIYTWFTVMNWNPALSRCPNPEGDRMRTNTDIPSNNFFIDYP